MTHRRDPNTRLRSLLAEAGWTQEALAREVNALGAEIGAELRYDRTAVAHWLSGTQPRPPVPRLAAEALTRRLGREITPGAAGFGPADGGDSGGDSGGDREGEGDGGTASGERDQPHTDPVAGLAALCRRDADAARRQRLHQRPYRVADSVVPPPPRGHLPPPRLTGRVPETAALHDAVSFFAASIDAHGGRHARSALAAYLADDVVPLLRARHPDPVHREILVAASRLSFLLARMYEDGQRHGAAQRYYAAAHRLAAEAGDRVLWCVVLRAMSAQAQRLGHLSAALQLAAASAQGSRGAPAPHQAYVHAQLAVVLGLSGDRQGTLAALAKAEKKAGQEAPAPDRGAAPFNRYPPAALHFQTSAALEALGDLMGALGALRRALGERSPQDVRGGALTRARLGHLLLRAGRLDEACAAWDGFLAAQHQLRSGEAERALRDMRRALAPHRRRPGAAELLARSAARTGGG